MFLISPARCGSDRARQLLAAKSDLGARLWEHSASIGELFTWLSSLYFRGKLTYAQRFGTAQIMAPGLGLCAPDLMLSAAMFRTMGTIEVESAAFVEPLVRDARLISTARVVLLGSIATGKYLTSLLDVFGDRLLFPATFVGRGDMSRGGLLLRAAKSGDELAYRSVAGAALTGARPPKLPRKIRAS